MRRWLPLLLAAVVVAAAAGVRVTSAYLTDGVSVRSSFVAAIPERTETEGGDATRAPEPTPRATPTPAPCDGEDARLTFRPAEVERRGAAPGTVTIVLANEGARAAALDVLLGLRTAGGAASIDRVAFGNGQVWLVGGQQSGTLYAAGRIPPGGSLAVPLTVSMLPGWQGQAGGNAEITVAITSGRCLDGPQHGQMAIRLDRAEGNAAPAAAPHP